MRLLFAGGYYIRAAIIWDSTVVNACLLTFVSVRLKMLIFRVIALKVGNTAQKATTHVPKSTDNNNKSYCLQVKGETFFLYSSRFPLGPFWKGFEKRLYDVRWPRQLHWCSKVKQLETYLVPIWNKGSYHLIVTWRSDGHFKWQWCHFSSDITY